jgi:hypothetical protein
MIKDFDDEHYNVNEQHMNNVDYENENENENDDDAIDDDDDAFVLEMDFVENDEY